ncbi:MAG: hypothetical protein K8T26_01035 [Lentisphaerae bacterium]|nr:hypothetical protein [Lentisphaerota bacterium]
MKRWTWLLLVNAALLAATGLAELAPPAATGKAAVPARPTLATTGPQPANATNIVYRRVADGDWRVGDSETRAPFRFGVNGRDIMVEPGDNLVFQRITFDAGNVNVGPVWNYYNDNTNATEVTFEDCIFNGGLCVTTVGRMRVNIRRSRTNGYTGFTPSPDALVTVSQTSMIAAHGGDAARVGRARHNDGFPYGPDSRTPVIMRDCLIRTTGPSNPGDHRDAIQVFGGSGILFSNVVFDLNFGEFTTVAPGQNVALFIEDASNGSVSDIDVVDCWIEASGSYFLMGIQHRSGEKSRNINLIRPRLSKYPAANYADSFPAFREGIYTVVDPVYSDDFSPVPLSAFGL